MGLCRSTNGPQCHLQTINRSGMQKNVCVFVCMCGIKIQLTNCRVDVHFTGCHCMGENSICCQFFLMLHACLAIHMVCTICFWHALHDVHANNGFYYCQTACYSHTMKKAQLLLSKLQIVSCPGSTMVECASYQYIMNTEKNTLSLFDEACMIFSVVST